LILLICPATPKSKPNVKLIPNKPTNISAKTNYEQCNNIEHRRQSKAESKVQIIAQLVWWMDCSILLICPASSYQTNQPTSKPKPTMSYSTTQNTGDKAARQNLKYKY